MEAKKMNWIKRSVAVVLALLVAITFLPFSGFNMVTAKADAGDPPAHGKSLIINEDGTYTLALSVTGDAEKVTEPVNTNVIVILDTSGSMDENTGNTETTYTPSNQNANNMYGTNDGETFFPIYRHGGGFFNPYYYTIGQSAQSERYTGQRYLRQVANQTRLEAAQDAINDLAEALLSKNGQDGNPSDLIEMALVTFDTTARVSRTPTTSLTQFQNAVNNTEAGGGTNWEAGLSTANNINFGDSDQTFVIFVSDGNPTFRTTQNGWNDRYQQGVYGTGQETNQNITRCYTTAVPAAQTLANKVTVGNFFTIGAYGNVDRMESLTTNAGAPAANYFTAENTAALQEALASILEKIEMAGIAEAEIQDGTTNQVATTSSGTVSLLDVDTNSFKYYRAGGTTEEGDEKYDSDANTETTADGETLYLGEEWTGSDVPAATFEDSAVNWDLSPIGVLEDDVTYTVTFNVWPSQTTLDYIADIENGLYDTLPEEVQQYIDEEGNLQTNTEATLTWVDTRDGSVGSEDFVNPDPVSSSAVEQLTVAKEWQNDVDGQTSAPIELEVTRDGTHKYDVILSSANNWRGNVYISIGIMRTGADGNMEILAEGHDFTFVEPEDIGYRWELDVPVVHPMLIDGTLTMLTKVDDAHPAPSGADTYTIKGATYYVSGGSEASLTATNYRRSQLVLTKVVTGEDVPEDATFPFTLTVNNSKADEGTEDNLDSDYWVWFTTINDQGENTDDVTVTGATKEEGEDVWYHVASGTSFTVDLPAGYSVRFINLPKDSTYTFVEGTLDTGFKFVKAELTKGEDEDFEGDQTSTGKIVDWNNEYEVTYTNEYALVNVTVDKVWDDASDQDGLRPETLTLTLNGLPEGTDAPTPEITKSTDGNTWTYKWSGLPKYDADGEEIEYTVTEGTVPEGYTCATTTVDPDGTITNTHTPETTSISVEKVWVDNNNQDGVRPGSVTVRLKANGTEIYNQVLSDDNKWTYTWPNLPVKASGADIEYTITEDTVTDYTPNIPDPEKTDDGLAFTVTNTHTPLVTSITATKAWSDNNDQDGIRPGSVEFVLYKNGEATDTKITLDGKADDQGETAAWTATFSDLPQKEGGQEITYTVSEDTVPEGYTKSPTDPVGNNGTITNTHEPETTTATITKVWEDNDDQDGLRPTTLAVDLYKQVGEGERAKVQTYTLEASKQWTLTADNLPKYEAGTEITYSWTETNVPANYTCGETTVANGGTITNTHTPETTTIEVTKVWEDNEPDHDDIQVQLMADGENYGAPVTLSDNNEWTYTWEDSEELPMPKYKDGKEITYTVDEVEVPAGYTKSISGSAADGFTITNKISSVIVDPPVQKIIVGKDDLYNKGDFTFKIENVSAVGPDGEAIEEIPMPENTSITNSSMWERADKPGFYEFGVIEFTQPGTYVYKATETGKVDGVKNDPEAETGKTITFEVTEDPETGALIATPGMGEAQFTFTNTYTAEPETGDHSNMTFWMIAMIIAGLGIIGLTVFRLRKKENEGK